MIQSESILSWSKTALELINCNYFWIDSVWIVSESALELTFKVIQGKSVKTI